MTCIQPNPSLITMFHLETSEPCRDLPTELVMVVQGHLTHDNIADEGPGLIMVNSCGVGM